MTTMKNVLRLTKNMQQQNKSSIHNRKRVLIDEFLSSTDEQIKDLQLDDHAIEAIFDCLEHPERDLELFRAIMKRLYEIYRSQDGHLRLVALIFIPTLIAIYIRFHHANSCWYQNEDDEEIEKTTEENGQNEDEETDRLNPNSSIAVLLLFVYNFEIIHQKTGELKTLDIRVISLAKPSIYHEPNSNTAAVHTAIPTEQVLAKINNPNESKITIFGPYHEVEQLNTGNQQSVFTVLLKVYNQHLQQVGYYSLQSMCRMYVTLLRQGSNTGISLKQQIKSIIDDNNFSCSPNITSQMLQVPFSSEFLTEVMRSAYFCYYNELEDLAGDLIEEIARRATYKFYADVILMVNAFKNTHAIINRDREDHVAKIKKMNQSQISLNAAAAPPSMSSVAATIATRKAAITNASFKTRKLPDDIPIVAVTPNATPDAQYANAIRQAKQAARNTGQQPPSVAKVQQPNGRSPAVTFKSLDSINEESSTATSSPTSTQKPSRAANQKGANHVAAAQQQQTNPKKKGMMNLFKELKDKPKKSSKNSSSAVAAETNGKMTNQEMIPMKSLKNFKKFIDDDEGDGVDDDDDDAGQTSDSTGNSNILLARLDDADGGNGPENGDDDDNDNFESLPGQDELLLNSADRDAEGQLSKPSPERGSIADSSCNLSVNTGSSDRERSSSGESGVALLSGISSNNQKTASTTSSTATSSNSNHPVIKTLSDSSSSSFHHHQHSAKSVKKMSIHNSIN